MKFLIFSEDYPQFIDDLYRAQPELAALSYADHARAYFAESFGTANFFSTNLNNLGHEAIDVIWNNVVLQRAWLREHGLPIKAFGDWLQALPVPLGITRRYQQFLLASSHFALLKQVERFKPDVLYVQLMNSLTVGFLKRLKTHCRIMIGQIACPPPPMSYFEPFDLILSSFPHFVDRFRRHGIKSEFFRLAFESTILERVNNAGPNASIYDCVFIGGYTPRHAQGNAAFEKIAESFNVKFFGYGVENLPASSAIRRNFEGPCWGRQMYDTLRRSRIVLNRHISDAGSVANNMRLFEATGVGSFLLTDWKENLGELFEVGKEVEAYRSSDELAEKIEYYLANESLRQKIAMAGQEKTLRAHSYEIRMQELVHIVRKYLP